MTKTESLYFDLVRVGAALLVLIGHVVQVMPGAVPLEDHGHLAVICFFVLSGYVISFVSDTKEHTGQEYLVSRAARIYSVALPAIILTALCDLIGRYGLGHAIYSQMPSTWPLVRIAASLTFTNELWFQSVTLFSNGPYWSLCYEVWYYAIFGAAIYLRGHFRYIAVAVLAVMAGPKILVLFPIWLVGVALYRTKWVLSFPAGATAFAVSIAGILWLALSDQSLAMYRGLMAIAGPQWFKVLEFSAGFPIDYLFTILVALNFVAVRSFDGRIRYSKWAQNSIRWAAASTFSLYLFHRPILVLLVSIHPVKPSPGNAVMLTGATIILAVLLSYATERRKAFWKAGVTRIVSAVQGFRASPAVLIPGKLEEGAAEGL